MLGSKKVGKRGQEGGRGRGGGKGEDKRGTCGGRFRYDDSQEKKPSVARVLQERPLAGERGRLQRNDLEEAIMIMMDRMTKEDLDRLRSNMEQHGAVTLGTMCSVTDLCASSVQAVLQCIDKKFMLKEGTVSLRHRFSCDIKPCAQQFILQMHSPGPESLFGDVAQLAGVRAFDLRTSEPSLVPAVMWVVAGFCCTDVSHMNVGSKHTRDTIRKLIRRLAERSTAPGRTSSASARRPSRWKRRCDRRD